MAGRRVGGAPGRGAALRVHEAARRLRAGGVVAHPTEAVFGLGCLPLAEPALERIVAIKRRPPAMGMILIGSRVRHLARYVEGSRAELEARLLDAGPRATTWVARAVPGLPRLLTGGRGTVAVRLTRHPLAAALCEALGEAIVSTSANRSGGTPLRDARSVRLRLGRELDAVLAGECGGEERPSRIVDLASARVLRE